MGAKSAIGWTDATWNPVTGCNKVSPRPKHCYVERLAVHLRAMGHPRYRRGFEDRTMNAAWQLSRSADVEPPPARGQTQRTQGEVDEQPDERAHMPPTPGRLIDDDTSVN